MLNSRRTPAGTRTCAIDCTTIGVVLGGAWNPSKRHTDAGARNGLPIGHAPVAENLRLDLADGLCPRTSAGRSTRTAPHPAMPVRIGPRVPCLHTTRPPWPRTDRRQRACGAQPPRSAPPGRFFTPALRLTAAQVSRLAPSERATSRWRRPFGERRGYRREPTWKVVPDSVRAWEPTILSGSALA